MAVIKQEGLIIKDKGRKKTPKYVKEETVVAVYQKTKDDVRLTLKPNQKGVINFFRENQVSLLTGDPGTGKTTLAMYYALIGLYNGEFKKITLSKPLVEAGSQIGHLPGTEEEKSAPYMESFIDVMDKMIGRVEREKLFKSGKVEFKPLQFLRGKTFDYSCIIADEVQNLAIKDIMSFVTRFADSSTMILLGDYFQSDIRNSGINKFIELSSGIDGIGYLELDDSFQMRSKLICKLYGNYKKYVLNGGK
jgi:phosphate starvation-inducible PhoH-like protein